MYLVQIKEFLQHVLYDAMRCMKWYFPTCTCTRFTDPDIVDRQMHFEFPGILDEWQFY